MNKENGRAGVSGRNDADQPLLETIGLLIRKIYQKNQIIWNEMCPDPQMTSPQASVLFALRREGPCSLTDLGRATAMDPATTRGVVDRLSKRNMLMVLDDETDRRKVILRLEAPGHQFVEMMIPVVPQIANATLSPLNPAEQIALKYLLAKMTQEDAKEGVD